MMENPCNNLRDQLTAGFQFRFRHGPRENETFRAVEGGEQNDSLSHSKSLYIM
jgi:hypothetical protein